MKLATLFLLALSAFAGRDDDWRRLPRNTPGAPIPEPSTYILMGLGLAGLAVLRRKRNRA